MDFERDFKGVWIPKEIWLNDELTMLEKCILVEIDSLDNEDGCNASNDYLAKFCQCGITKVATTISKLIKMGLIYQEAFNGRVRILKSRLSKSERQTFKKCKAQQEKESETKSEKESNKEKDKKLIKEKEYIINIDDYKENSIINNRAKESLNFSLICEQEGVGETSPNEEKREKPTKERKVNPTIEDVYEYANSRGRGDLAKMFYDYYEATNWYDSKGNKVKSWKGKFITWENNNPKKMQKQETNTFDILKKMLLEEQSKNGN